MPAHACATIYGLFRPFDFSATSRLHSVLDSQSLGLGNSPGHQYFTPNTVPELSLRFQDQDFSAILRHAFGEGCAAQSTTYRNNVVFCSGHDFLVVQAGSWLKGLFQKLHQLLLVCDGSGIKCHHHVFHGVLGDGRKIFPGDAPVSEPPGNAQPVYEVLQGTDGGG